MTATFGNYGRVNRNWHLVISRRSLPADHQKFRFTAGKLSVPASCPLRGVIYTSLQGYRWRWCADFILEGVVCIQTGSPLVLSGYRSKHYTMFHMAAHNKDSDIRSLPPKVEDERRRPVLFSIISIWGMLLIEFSTHDFSVVCNGALFFCTSFPSWGHKKRKQMQIHYSGVPVKISEPRFVAVLPEWQSPGLTLSSPPLRPLSTFSRPESLSCQRYACQKLKAIYICYIRPILEYASVTWSNLTRSEADQLERFQRRAARLILGIPLFKRVDHSLLLTAANLPTLESRRACALAVLGQQLFTGAVPNHLKGVNLPKRVATYELRRRQDTQIPTARTSAYRDSVILKSLHTFHSLPMSLQKIKSPHHFRAAAVKHLETHICTCSSQPLPH